MQVEVGRVLGHGRFEILSRIGEGGGGVVYEVRDRRSDAHLALKTVRAREPDALASLKREFRAVQDVDHPNLVRLDELFEENGAWFFTMELVLGEEWLAYVQPASLAGRVDEARLRSTIAQVIEALSVLHAKGTVHRDVKPSNVLVSAGGHVKLIDFGIATGAHRVRSEAEGIVGTAAFMAPEQVLAEEPTPASDLYAVGAMLYQALTGKAPFFDHSADVLTAKLNGAPLPVREVEPRAPQDLAELCDALLRLDPKERPDGSRALEIIGARHVASEKMRAAPSDFVGRADELESLRRAFTTVRHGGTATAIVEGISGVGKSAIVGRFLEEIENDAIVFHAKCNEREYVPYNGIDAIVEGLATYLLDVEEGWHEGISARATRLLPRLFPALKRVPYFADAADEAHSMVDGAPNELRARIFAAFRELLARIAQRRPLVLAIDDVQWADGDTLALLAELLAPPFPPRVLLLCSRRLAQNEAQRASLAPALRLPGDVRRIRIGALPGADVALLLSRLSKGVPLAEAARMAIATESGGHPLFLQELVRLNAVDGRKGEARTGHVRLDDALWARVTLLAEREQRLVHTIAVAGLPTSLDIVAASAEIPPRDIPALMAALRGANVVKISGSAGRKRIETYHDRFRESVISHLDEDAKRGVHRRLAAAFEASAERDVERLAAHYDGAGNGPKAAELYREAAERATAALAFDRAADFLLKAHTLGGPSSPARDDVERALSVALLNAGRGGEAASTLLSLASRSTSDEAIELRGRAANAFLSNGHFDEGIAELRGVLGAAGFTFPRTFLAVLFMVLWQRLRLKLRGLGFTPRDPGTIARSTLTRIDVCWAVAHGFGMTDAIIGGAFHTLGARLALDSGDTYRAARALAGYSLTASIAGRTGRAHTEQVIRKLRELNATLRDPYVDAFICAGEGFAAYMLENWVAADKRFRDAIVGFRDRCVGATYELGTVRNMLGRTLANRGRFVELETLMAPTLRDAIRRNDLFNVINVRGTSASLLALTHGDTDIAQTEVDETKALLSTRGFQVQHVYWLLAAGNLDIYRGDPRAALDRFAAHDAALKRSLLTKVQSVRVMIAHLRARAHLALAERDPSGAAPHIAAASVLARKLRGEQLPAAEAFGFLIEAGVSMLAGQREAAMLSLRDVIARFEKNDMSVYAAAARDRLGRCLGGDEGERLIQTASTFFASEKVAAAPRFITLYAPGFRSVAEG